MMKWADRDKQTSCSTTQNPKNCSPSYPRTRCCLTFARSSQSSSKSAWSKILSIVRQFPKLSKCSRRQCSIALTKWQYRTFINRNSQRIKAQARRRNSQRRRAYRLSQWSTTQLSILPTCKIWRWQCHDSCPELTKQLICQSKIFFRGIWSRSLTRTTSMCFRHSVILIHRVSFVSSRHRFRQWRRGYLLVCLLIRWGHRTSKATLLACLIICSGRWSCKFAKSIFSETRNKKPTATRKKIQ